MADILITPSSVIGTENIYTITSAVLGNIYYFGVNGTKAYRVSITPNVRISYNLVAQNQNGDPVWQIEGGSDNVFESVVYSRTNIGVSFTQLPTIPFSLTIQVQLL